MSTVNQRILNQELEFHINRNKTFKHLRTFLVYTLIIVALVCLVIDFLLIYFLYNNGFKHDNLKYIIVIISANFAYIFLAPPLILRIIVRFYSNNKDSDVDSDLANIAQSTKSLISGD